MISVNSLFKIIGGAALAVGLVISIPNAMAEGSFFKKPPTELKPEPSSITALSPPPQVDATQFSGVVSEVVDAATLIVGDNKVELAGIEPADRPAMKEKLANWLKSQGSKVECTPTMTKYRCLTTTGIDVAETAISNGAGKATPEAPTNYHSAETNAHSQRRGMWNR